MKKAFYMMAAAAIALSSCSSEETTDVAKSSTITFRTTVGLNSRGAELTSDNLQEMWVSAFYQSDGKSYFDDQKFTKETGTGTSHPLSFLNLHSTGRREEPTSLLPFHQKRLLGRLLQLLQRTR